MKKITSLLLILLFVSTVFAACGDDKEGTSSNIDSSVESSNISSTESELPNSSDAGDESEISEPASEPEESKPEESAIYSMSLEDIIKAVYASCDKTFDSYYNAPIEKENLAVAYGDDFECIEAFSSGPFINVTPYCFELYRVDAEKAEEIAALIEEKANLNKWVCVSAEAKITAVNGNVVMLCMSTKEECDQLAEAFKSIK